MSLRASAGEENAGGDLFDVEELRVRSCRHGPEPSCTVVGEFQETSTDESELYEFSEKIAARVGVRLRVVVCSIRNVHFGQVPLAASFVGSIDFDSC